MSYLTFFEPLPKNGMAAAMPQARATAPDRVGLAEATTGGGKDDRGDGCAMTRWFLWAKS